MHDGNGNHNHDDMPPLVILAESDHFAILLGEDNDSEEIYNIEMGSVTLHLFREEWEEFVKLIEEAKQA